MSDFWIVHYFGRDDWLASRPVGTANSVFMAHGGNSTNGPHEYKVHVSYFCPWRLWSNWGGCTLCKSGDTSLFSRVKEKRGYTSVVYLRCSSIGRYGALRHRISEGRMPAVRLSSFGTAPMTLRSAGPLQRCVEH